MKPVLLLVLVLPLTVARGQSGPPESSSRDLAVGFTVGAPDSVSTQNDQDLWSQQILPSGPLPRGRWNEVRRLEQVPANYWNQQALPLEPSSRDLNIGFAVGVPESDDENVAFAAVPGQELDFRGLSNPNGGGMLYTAPGWRKYGVNVPYYSDTERNQDVWSTYRIPGRSEDIWRRYRDTVQGQDTFNERRPGKVPTRNSNYWIPYGNWHRGDWAPEINQVTRTPFRNSGINQNNLDSNNPTGINANIWSPYRSSRINQKVWTSYSPPAILQDDLSPYSDPGSNRKVWTSLNSPWIDQNVLSPYSTPGVHQKSWAPYSTSEIEQQMSGAKPDLLAYPEIQRQSLGEPFVFKLRNDRGYKVTMDVPPAPTGEEGTGVLVMQMSATLYRPVNQVATPPLNYPTV